MTDVRDVRCVTVRPDWGWACIYGGKDVENRKQRTQWRGWLGIHAGLTEDRVPLRGRTPQEDLLFEAVAELSHRTHESAVAFDTRGAIIGLRKVADSHWASPGCCPSPWAEYDSGYPAHWVFEDDAIILVDPPLDARGRQGVWRPDEQTAAVLLELIAA